ncbi:DNA-binding response OmpR family regulator [Catenulispora sp. EB89]
MRVLVAEDDPGLAPLIVDGLRAAGCVVDLAERLADTRPWC